MVKISYEIELDSITTVTASAEGETKRVQVDLYRDREHFIINMDYLQAERFWHALKGCVDYAMRPQK